MGAQLGGAVSLRLLHLLRALAAAVGELQRQRPLSEAVAERHPARGGCGGRTASAGSASACDDPLLSERPGLFPDGAGDAPDLPRRPRRGDAREHRLRARRGRSETPQRGVQREDVARDLPRRGRRCVLDGEFPGGVEHGVSGACRPSRRAWTAPSRARGTTRRTRRRGRPPPCSPGRHGPRQPARSGSRPRRRGPSDPRRRGRRLELAHGQRADRQLIGEGREQVEERGALLAHRVEGSTLALDAPGRVDRDEA